MRATSHVAIDLSHALADDGLQVLRIAGLERTHWRLAGSVPTVLVTGTPHADDVTLTHTRFGPVRGLVTMDGFGGDDRLTTRIQPAILRGGAGSDLLRVRTAAGRLYGGPGDDLLREGRTTTSSSAVAGRTARTATPGTDRCAAETEIDCEAARRLRSGKTGPSLGTCSMPSSPVC